MQANEALEQIITAISGASESVDPISGGGNGSSSTTSVTLSGNNYSNNYSVSTDVVIQTSDVTISPGEVPYLNAGFRTISEQDSGPQVYWHPLLRQIRTVFNSGYGNSYYTFSRGDQNISYSTYEIGAYEDNTVEGTLAMTPLVGMLNKLSYDQNNKLRGPLLMVQSIVFPSVDIGGTMYDVAALGADCRSATNQNYNVPNSLPDSVLNTVSFGAQTTTVTGVTVSWNTADSPAIIVTPLASGKTVTAKVCYSYLLNGAIVNAQADLEYVIGDITALQVIYVSSFKHHIGEAAAQTALSATLLGATILDVTIN